MKIELITQKNWHHPKQVEQIIYSAKNDKKLHAIIPYSSMDAEILLTVNEPVSFTAVPPNDLKGGGIAVVMYNSAFKVDHIEAVEMFFDDGWTVRVSRMPVDYYHPKKALPIPAGFAHTLQWGQIKALAKNEGFKNTHELYDTILNGYSYPNVNPKKTSRYFRGYILHFTENLYYAHE